MEVVLIIIVIAVIAGVAYFGWMAAKKRREDLLAFAQANDLNYIDDKDYSFDERYDQFSCLDKGRNRYAYNLLKGKWKGQGFTGFDYHYETTSTDSEGRRKTHHHYFSAVILRLDFHFKNLFIRPEGFFDKVTEFFGYDDIDFESAEFSRKFFVKAKEKKWAYDVLHARTMEFLLAQPQFTIDFNGYDVMIYKSGKYKVEEFGTAADIACGIIDGLPDYVMKEIEDAQRVNNE